MDQAKALLEDPAATQKQVDQAASDLQAAWKQLEKKQEPSTNPAEDQPGRPQQNPGGTGKPGQTGNATNTPQTGDAAPFATLAGLAGASCLALCLRKRDRRSQ